MAPEKDSPRNERWQTVNRIFDAAVEMDASQRSAFVASESGGDAELQQQVDRLLNAHDSAGSWMSNAAVLPTLDNEPVSPGDVLCERFLVRRAIASGGMGTVYEAFDQALDTPVALKIIRQEVAHDPEALDRFRREVAVARRLTHKNLCRTFDLEKTIHRGKEIVFLTMEFLPGITLAQRLSAQGALPPDETLRIASAVAEALQTAHAMGVVHRDIKPANIMLVGDGSTGERVVLTDFGLARATSAVQDAATQHDALTRSGLPIGTLSYMAPEQLEGKPATAATDVYALGLVITEMLTGKRVFATRNTLSGLAERLHKAARLTTTLPTDAPAGWLSVLERSLQTDPAKRQQSAVALIEELEKASKHKRSALSQHLWSVRSGAMPVKRRVTLLTISLLIVVALSVVAFRLLRVERNSMLPQGAIVYLAPLKNESGARELDHVGTLLATELSQSSHMNLLDESRVAEILSAMKHTTNAPVDAVTAREIALRSGAARVVIGSIEKNSNHYALRVDIQQPDNDPSRYRTHWTKSFSWTTSTDEILSNDALAAIRDAGDWIRERVGESASDIARLNVPPEDATTASWQALEEYSHAEELLLAGRTDDGITALQRATEQDHNFSLAYARLGDALFSRNRWTEGLAAYRQAMVTTDRQRLTRRELDHVRGIYASDTLDDATAEAQFHDLEIFYPNDWLAWFYRALPLMRLGRMGEAMECLKRAHELAPHRISPTATLALFAMQSNDFSDAQRWVNELHKDGDDNEVAWLAGDMKFLQGDMAGAERDLQEVPKSPSASRAIRGYEFLSRLAAERGRIDASLSILQAGLKLAEAKGDKGNTSLMHMDIAWMECARGQYSICIDEAKKSLALDQTPHSMQNASLLAIRYAHNAPGPIQRSFRELLESNGALNHNDEIGPLFDEARLQAQGALQLVNRHCDAALRAFRAEGAIAAPVESREYLALGLEQCAALEASPQRAEMLRQEAAEAYAPVALQPGYAWYSPQFHHPGVVYDQLNGWLRNTTERGPKFQDAMQRLDQLRPHDSPGGSVRTIAMATETIH
jgi:serine/threonine protein kinase/Flp pilus assembly protein TadD